MIVFCDMDEVITDFIGGALKVHGWNRRELEALRIQGQWEITTPMGLSLEQFWEPIREKGKEFWENLEELPWGFRMINYLNLLENEGSIKWYVLTCPDETVDSYLGKYQWWNNHYGPEYCSRLITIGHKNNGVPGKELLAGIKDAVLIDDRQENVDKFVAAGGKAILFPSNGNTLHKYATNPVEFVIQGMEDLNALLL